MTEIEIKKTTYEIATKSELERELEDASDKVQAAAKAVVNKVKDPHKDLGTEYIIEKKKEKLD
jgi:hypothetical protein